MSFAVEADSFTHVQIEDVIDFLNDIPLAGSVVSKTGEVIHLNEKMSSIVGYNHGEEKFKCGWINEDGDASCPDCAEAITLDGRCLISRENQAVSLLAAIRIPQADNILVRIYSDSLTIAPEEAERTINQLLDFANPTNKYSNEAKFSFLNEDGLTSVRVNDIVESVTRLPELSHVDTENRIDASQVIELTSPIILRQMILNILMELGKIDILGSIVIKNMRHAVPADENLSHLLSFQAKSLRALGKSKSSELTAMGLRLKIFRKNLTMATGLEVDAPIVFRENDMIEVQFSISNRLNRAAMDTSENDNNIYNNLSAREQEIVEMVRYGYDNMGISQRLGITHATVKQHLKAIYRKAGVKNRVQLIFKDAPPTP